MPKSTAPRRTRAIQISISRWRARRGLSVGMPLLDSPYRPLRLLAEERVAVRQERGRQRRVVRSTGVAESDERVATQEARVVARHVQALVSRAQRVAVILQPVCEPYVSVSRRLTRAPLLDA